MAVTSDCTSIPGISDVAFETSVNYSVRLDVWNAIRLEMTTHRGGSQGCFLYTNVACPAILRDLYDQDIEQKSHRQFPFETLLRVLEGQKGGDIENADIQNVTMVLNALHGGRQCLTVQVSKREQPRI